MSDTFLWVDEIDWKFRTWISWELTKAKPLRPNAQQTWSRPHKKYLAYICSLFFESYVFSQHRKIIVTLMQWSSLQKSMSKFTPKNYEINPRTPMTIKLWRQATGTKCIRFPPPHYGAILVIAWNHSYISRHLPWHCLKS